MSVIPEKYTQDVIIGFDHYYSAGNLKEKKMILS